MVVNYELSHARRPTRSPPLFDGAIIYNNARGIYKLTELVSQLRFELNL